MSQQYHCSIYEIRPGGDKQFTGPFSSVDELVRFTGLPYDQWLKQYKEVERMIRQGKNVKHECCEEFKDLL